MSTITVWFIRFAILYFLAAMLIGIAMTMTGPIYPYMQIHAHFNLLGWMSMMIYGVGYHILPRFSGKPLWSDRLSYWHIWLANAGLLGMTAGWFALSAGLGRGVLLGFAMVEGASMIMFGLNMFKTIKAIPPPLKPAVK